mmetsp:Transcript_6973/g.30529  ORF Transcript_6973/g.30529 Transcript_6973/m.30529 type:complete len:168 (-) Transcript_6973:2614-3117(-)
MRYSAAWLEKIFAAFFCIVMLSFAGIAPRSGVVRKSKAVLRRNMGVKREPVGAGEESVWDYPRPPRLEREKARLKVVFNGVTVADSTNGFRVLETSHPPVYYIPMNDCKMEYMKQSAHRTYCEFKGTPNYYDLSVNGKEVSDVAWSYPNPDTGMEAIKDALAFYGKK